MQPIALSFLVILSVGLAQQWDSFDAHGNSDSGFFSRIADFFEDSGNAKMFGAPPFLRKLTRQAKQNYYKIFKQKDLTRAQIQTAVAKWAATNNITSEVNAHNLKQRTEKSKYRAEVSAAVRQLPALIAQLNAINDDQRLRPSDATAQIHKILSNTTPRLLKLARTVLPGPLNGRDYATITARSISAYKLQMTVGAQFLFMPFMIQGSEYNCSAVMPPGQAWADQYGVKQYKFGTYSLVFGLVTEILYIPCTLGLRKDLKTSCFKIMFWLSILDMTAIMANSILFGILLLQGAVYCSNPTLTIGVGIVAYYVWCTASACCMALGINRLCEMLGLSNFFTSTKTNIYLAICTTYGLLMVFFTRPVSVNSTLQSMFFSPFIPGHGLQEYVNLSHATHNIVIAASSCLLYMTLTVVIVVKSRMIVAAERSRSRVINNIPVFAQVMLIMLANLIGTLIYVYMNFIPAPPALIVTGHVAWQFIHGSPPFIYLALNKTIRQFAMRSIGLDRILNTNSTRVVAFSSTHGSTSRN